MGFNGMEKDDEVKGKGNHLDFGARVYDSRLARWLSLDPLAVEYPSISPCVFVANSPLMFIDPDGERLVLSNDVNGNVLAQLQRLTNDVLAVNKKTGEVYIKKAVSDKVHNSTKIHGRILIRAIISHSRTTTITINEKQLGSGVDYPDKYEKNAYNGGGVDPTIIFTKNNGAAQYRDNGKTVSLQQKADIVLGGELIHALIAMDGNKDNSGNASHTYINIFGEEQVETRNINELKTHGIGGYRYGPSLYRKWYPTENDLRRDNGEPERISYEDDLQHKYKPQNKEKLEKYEKENEK